MLYSVRGKLIQTTATCAVVECGGVGFLCQTTLNTLKTLKPGSEVMLYTYLNVREDAMELFGFATKTELDTFKTLISVSGVGPKAGLALLSELASDSGFAPVSAAAVSAAGGNVSKAIEALGVLGYTPAEVSPVLAQFDGNLPVEQLIAMTLRQMGRQ